MQVCLPCASKVKMVMGFRTAAAPPAPNTKKEEDEVAKEDNGDKADEDMESLADFYAESGENDPGKPGDFLDN